ncbi:MAG: hypothetical protein ACFFCM_20865 [Promethearchaeota archaeon]
MPIGILVIRWDNEIGPINEGFYPDTLKPGFASISLKNNKVVSFFSGVGDSYISVENYVVALLLRRDEKPYKYRDVLKTIAAEILDKIPDQSFRSVLPDLYQQLAKV